MRGAPWRLLVLAVPLMYLLYFFGLASIGLVGPDEPRYAAISQEMAGSGDWITPRLWGQPWFEKPALLYWMTAAGFRLGLDEDLAPRLPVALASLVFLIFYWVFVRKQFGERVASYSTLFLGGSIGWIAFSRVAVTDLPLSICFSAAMFLVLANGPAATIAAGCC